MRLGSKEIKLSGGSSEITVCRGTGGVPTIGAENLTDLMFGLGWTCAYDRQVQALLTRLLLRGIASEHLGGDEALMEADKYFRRSNFLPDAQEEIDKLTPETLAGLKAYAAGFNKCLSERGVVLEFRLLGYKPQPWEVSDSLLIAKVFGFLGLADAQGNMEKLLVEMIQKGVETDKLKELFPYLTDEIDRKQIEEIKLAPPLIPEAVSWIRKPGAFSASNNWAISGKKCKSGEPILCGDPHLEINRLPGIWQEVIMKLPDNTLIGTTIPGCPGLILGRTNHLAWSATYSFMDSLDFRIEHCKDGKYRRGNSWEPFSVRTETIKVKKGEDVVLKVYENEHGLLEGDPFEEGCYLVQSWSSKHGCGATDLEAVAGLVGARTVPEAMELFRMLDAASFNFVIADTEGNIGFQMSGRQFKRPEGVSGLLPLPGWLKEYDSVGFVDKKDLPSQYNPSEGFIVTANEDLNHLGKSNPINLPMASYRSNRIKELLKDKKKFDVNDMKRIHYDLYSLQAEAFMKIIGPLLPDTENGKILRNWDCRYEAGSKGATLFEEIYRALINIVFGDNGLGRDVIEHIMSETSMFNDYYGNLDRIMLADKSAWFADRKRKDIFIEAIAEGLDVKPISYGETRKITLDNLLLGGKMPRIFGIDRGPIELPGNRATITQGQIFKSAGRVTTFSPSFRMIADMSTRELHTNMAGGPSDRWFTKLYANGLADWQSGKYKILK
jgi:penicillin G amidase